MKRFSPLLSVLAIIFFSNSACSQSTVSNKEEQIKVAVLAAPEEARDAAHVYGYDDDGNFVTLREGSNDFICIADNPNREGFEVVSYHVDLEPFMARGRALREEGKSGQERSNIRAEEADNGKLKMPKKAATLHVYYGRDVEYDSENNTLKGAKYRYAVYMPYATQQSTGLSLTPNGPGHPWLMFPGQHNAHIMITPPTTDNN